MNSIIFVLATPIISNTSTRTKKQSITFETYRTIFISTPIFLFIVSILVWKHNTIYKFFIIFKPTMRSISKTKKFSFWNMPFADSLTFAKISSTKTKFRFWWLSKKKFCVKCGQYDKPGHEEFKYWEKFPNLKPVNLNFKKNQKTTKQW